MHFIFSVYYIGAHFFTLLIICTGDKKTSNNLLKNVVIFSLTQLSGFVSLIDSLLRWYKPLDYEQVITDAIGSTTE